MSEEELPLEVGDKVVYFFDPMQEEDRKMLKNMLESCNEYAFSASAQMLRSHFKTSREDAGQKRGRLPPEAQALLDALLFLDENWDAITQAVERRNQFVDLLWKIAEKDYDVLLRKICELTRDTSRDEADLKPLISRLLSTNEERHLAHAKIIVRSYYGIGTILSRKIALLQFILRTGNIPLLLDADEALEILEDKHWDSVWQKKNSLNDPKISLSSVPFFTRVVKIYGPQLDTHPLMKHLYPFVCQHDNVSQLLAVMDKKGILQDMTHPVFHMRHFVPMFSLADCTWKSTPKNTHTFWPADSRTVEQHLQKTLATYMSELPLEDLPKEFAPSARKKGFFKRAKMPVLAAAQSDWRFTKERIAVVEDVFLLYDKY